MAAGSPYSVIQVIFAGNGHAPLPAACVQAATNGQAEPTATFWRLPLLESKPCVRVVDGEAPRGRVEHDVFACTMLALVSPATLVRSR